MKARGTIPARPRWRALARRIALEDKLAIGRAVGYEPHPGQVDIHASRARFRVVCCGRRFGKSYLSSLEAIVIAVLGGWAMIVAPTYKLADIVFRESLRMLQGSTLRPLIARLNTAAGQQDIWLETGGRILVRSSENPTSLLGEGIDLVIFDEAAEETDEAVLTMHLRPTLLDRDGSILFVSTPEGDNWFKDAWQKGMDRVQGYQSWQMPSATNPYVRPEVLEREMAELPEATIRQEYLAEFLDSVGAVFRGVHAVATHRPGDTLPGSRLYALGVDLARYEDFTVITVLDVMARTVVEVIRMREVDWPAQVEIIASVAERYGYAPVLMDATGVGDPVVDMLKARSSCRVEPFVFTSATKTQIINQLALAIEHQEVTLLTRDPAVSEIGWIMARELTAYRYERTPAGTLRMSAPPGRHDDCVISLALALEMSRRVGGGIPINTVVPTVRQPLGPIRKAFGGRERRSIRD